MPKNRLAWIALGLLALTPPLLWGSARTAAARTLRRHAAEIERLETEFLLRAGSRPCAFDALPGDPGPPIQQAAAILDAMTDEESREVEDLRYNDVDPDLEITTAILRKYAPALDLLREAARRTPRPGMDPAVWNTAKTDTIVPYLHSVAGHERRAGRSAEALDAMFLLLGLMQDSAWTRGEFSQLRNHERRVFEHAKLVFAGHALAAARIDPLLARLDRLEASRPTLLDSLNLEDRETRRRALKAPLDEPHTYGAYRPRQPSWRTWWSEVVARAASLEEVEEYYRIRRGFAAKPWPERAPAALAYMETRVGRFVEPPDGHGLQIDAVEDHETDAATLRALLRAALVVAKAEIETGRLPAEVPGRPLAPDSGKPFLIQAGAVVAPHPLFDNSIPVKRR